MIDNWWYLIIGFGVFFGSFILPWLASRTQNGEFKGFLYFVDGTLTIVSIILLIAAFSNAWVGAAIVILSMIIFSTEYLGIMQAHNIPNPYIGKPYFHKDK